jgi:hypothetical protein
MHTLVKVLLPLPFLPMMACVSPSLMVSVTPFRIWEGAQDSGLRITAHSVQTVQGIGSRF